LLLDKEAFPRDKPCGGGVCVRAARLLPFDLTPVVERTAYGVQFSLRQTRSFSLRSSNPLTYQTQRSRLDTLLVERAVAAGVRLRERSPIRSVERYSSHVVIRGGNQIFEGRALVAADGANGSTARLAGLKVYRRIGIAMEANATPPGGVPREWEDLVGLDLGAVPGGYGWIFPRGDHVNIGVGGWLQTAASLRGHLAKLVRFYGLDAGRLWGVRGYHLPVRRPDAPLVDGNILLVGDAAGLLDPLTGEGIHAAIWSGSVAARHLTAFMAGGAPDLRGYHRDVAAGLLPDLRVAERVHALVDRSPGAFAACVRYMPGAWDLLCHILRGDQTYIGFVRQFRWAIAARRVLTVRRTVRRVLTPRGTVAGARRTR
ncbi:MAG: NAD(P)/FAD-dependent oxidoreductase, partial [Armatimonadota bacterium]